MKNIMIKKVKFNQEPKKLVNKPSNVVKLPIVN